MVPSSVEIPIVRQRLTILGGGGCRHCRRCIYGASAGNCTHARRSHLLWHGGGWPADSGRFLSPAAWGCSQPLLSTHRTPHTAGEEKFINLHLILRFLKIIICGKHVRNVLHRNWWRSTHQRNIHHLQNGLLSQTSPRFQYLGTTQKTLMNWRAHCVLCKPRFLL